jgi:hypothetical protein
MKLSRSPYPFRNIPRALFMPCWFTVLEAPGVAGVRHRHQPQQMYLSVAPGLGFEVCLVWKGFQTMGSNARHRTLASVLRAITGWAVIWPNLDYNMFTSCGSISHERAKPQKLKSALPTGRELHAGCERTEASRPGDHATCTHPPSIRNATINGALHANLEFSGSRRGPWAPPDVPGSLCNNY